MARAVATHTWRDSTPSTIEVDLAALWRDMGREVPVARAVMSNLVVVCERSGDALPYQELAERLPLDEVVARHPSRVILIEFERCGSALRAPLGAGVGIVTFGPPQARYGVEEIGVRSACADQSLPSIVRRLIRGDLATSLWWTSDLSWSAPPSALVSMARQLIYDSSEWRDMRRGVEHVAAFLDSGCARRVHLADLNWRRLASVRRALVRAADLLESAEWRHSELRIAHRPGDGMLAWLLAGWLGARLEWLGDRLPRVDEESLGGEVLSIAIGSSRGISIDANDHRVVLRHGQAAPITIAVPQADQAESVAAELRTPSQDGPLREALAYLMRSFGR
jgi:glucose-6-phosphate dehydrogenase assembly protein OpcA